MAQPPKKEHPAATYNRARHHLFSVYEKTRDIDVSLAVLERYRLKKTSTYGLKAELLFYDQYYIQYKLEPLLDAGVKADFSGVRNKSAVNFDVTTNLQYKDINKYVDIVQKKKKRYELALVDLKSEEVDFFPLRFPICPECGLFSHYILFMSRPSSRVHFLSSTGQALIHYCSPCDRFDIIKIYRYVVPSIKTSIENARDYEMDPEIGDPDFDLAKFIKEKSIPKVQFFESQSQKMLSALVEGDYILTDPHSGDGYFGGKIFWTHPLTIRYFDDTIDHDFYDGTYSI